jgi:hypothetical protein
MPKESGSTFVGFAGGDLGEHSHMFVYCFG